MDNTPSHLSLPKRMSQMNIVDEINKYHVDLSTFSIEERPYAVSFNFALLMNQKATDFLEVIKYTIGS